MTAAQAGKPAAAASARATATAAAATAATAAAVAAAAAAAARAAAAAAAVAIASSIIDDLLSSDRPDWLTHRRRTNCRGTLATLHLGCHHQPPPHTMHAAYDRHPSPRTSRQQTQG